MCAFVGVGSLADGKPEGCWVSRGRVGLMIPKWDGTGLSEIAVEGDYITRTDGGILYVWTGNPSDS